ncbi:glycosyltransferase [Proteinivorax tanatarense]|uniref:Glycosyltransferase n=1 Tax=Proteinivorax tanatarense TaxID=1260629 RepID=A0AAU7VMS0_9FIRM
MMGKIILLLLALYGFWSILNAIYEKKLSTKKSNANLSVLLITSNWEEKAEKVIRYLANQNYFNRHPLTPADVVVIDKGSKDNTLQILKQLARNYSFLKVIDGKKNNYSKILQYGKEKCHGEVVILFDQDDFSSLEELEKAIKFYFSYPNCKLSGSNEN